MLLKRLRCLDFRGFSELEIEFEERLTVLVGANGAGKSSILDALAVLLSQYAARMLSSSNSARRLKDTDIRWRAGQAQLDLVVVDERVGEINWGLVKQGPRQKLISVSGSSRLTGLNEFVRNIAERSSEENFLQGEVAPVYYDQTRAILKIPKRHAGKPSDTDAAVVFRDSLGDWGIDFPRLTAWFKDRESDELRRQKQNRQYVDRELEAARQAMTTATGFRDPYFSVDAPKGLTVRKGEATLHVSQLSTGEQVFLALAADLARRLSSLVDEYTPPLSARAIVLIDEVELHLHPRWQRRIIPWLLETFPNCQFVVTTHSPQVLSEVSAESIRILVDEGHGPEIYAAPPTFGRDSNHLLASVFDVSTRREHSDELLKATDLALTKGNLQQARALLVELREEIEGGAPEIAIMEARLARRTTAR